MKRTLFTNLLLFLLIICGNVALAQRSSYSHSIRSGSHFKSQAVRSGTRTKISSRSAVSKSRSNSIKSVKAHNKSKKPVSSQLSPGHQHSTFAIGVARDSHGKIKRSSKARHDFMKQTGFPHGRKGYIIDHIVPLSKGGSDSPSNMQWQTKAAAKQKDKTERK